MIRLLVVIVYLIYCCCSPIKAPDPDETQTFAQLVESRGFRLLEYTVTTEDGYILIVHRVVPKIGFNATTYSQTRKPVIFFHGIWCQSSIIFINSPFLKSADSKCGDNLGFGLILTQRYDIWVPNSRGNGVSNGHVNLSTANVEYWKFSYEAIGLFDVPAILNLVRGETRHQTVAWIGYSQGGQSLLALLSLHPHYAQYIHPFIGLAATSYMGSARSPTFNAFQLFRSTLELFPGPYRLTEHWNLFSQSGCRLESGSHLLCAAAYSLMFGPSSRLNISRLPVYNHFVPKPSSNWQVAHILQNMASKRYARFDYDSGRLVKGRNRQVYGQDSPPDWPLERIPKNFTAVMIYGSADYLSGPEDAMRLVNELQQYGVNISGLQVEGEWNHLDFILGIGAGRLVYDRVIQILDDNVIFDGSK